MVGAVNFLLRELVQRFLVLHWSWRNFRCNTCRGYIYKGKKFNSRKENVDEEFYLGLRIFRFYIKCPTCVAEIAFKVCMPCYTLLVTCRSGFIRGKCECYRVKSGSKYQVFVTFTMSFTYCNATTTVHIIINWKSAGKIINYQIKVTDQ